MNKKDISIEEAKLIDVSLKYIINLFHDNSVIYTQIHGSFEKNGIKKERIEIVMNEIYSLNLMNRTTDRGSEKLEIDIHRDKIVLFLLNGGLTNLLLEIETKKTNIILSNKTLKQFPITRTLAIVGSIVSILLLLKELYVLIYKQD